MMTGLWLGLALLLVAAAAFLVVPYLQFRGQAGGQGRQQSNVDIFLHRQQELQRELADGRLEQAEHDSLLQELEKNLLIDAEQQDAVVKVQSAPKWPVLAMMAVLVVGSSALYYRYGAAEQLQLAIDQANQPALDPHQAMAQLQQRLEQQPDDPEGWYVLASSYFSLGRYQQAVESYQQLLKYLPEQAPQYVKVQGEYVQALYFVDSGLSARVQQIIDQLLARDSADINALSLLGINAFEQANYAAAVDYWQKALAVAGPNQAQSLREGIAKAQQIMGQAVTAAAGPGVSLLVDIAEPLKDEIPAQAAVFVFARAEQGAPVAAVKLQVSELPLTLRLDDRHAMLEQSKISMQKVVLVSARISKAGQPVAAAGDWSAATVEAEVALEGEPIKLTIDHVVQ